MAKLTFLELAESVLEKVKTPLTANEIWEKSQEFGLAKDISTTGKTPWRSIGAQIYVDLRDNPKSIFAQPTKRPAKFGLKKYSGNIPKEYEKPQIQEDSVKFQERDLHPLVVCFADADSHFKAHLKTIYHENSFRTKKGLNKWLHPDLVGVYFPFNDFEKSTLNLQERLLLNSVKLFSFELKISVNLSNLRESYFQAISNSSWANEGYLVAKEIDDDPDFVDELRRLNNAFGLGIIKLNTKSIHESEILFPSRINQELDWDTVNRLTEENTDFKKFIEDIVEDIKIGKVKSEYDELLNDEELEKHIKDKRII